MTDTPNEHTSVAGPGPLNTMQSVPTDEAAYEAEQISNIARWKSTSPSRLAAAVDTATAPVTWLVGHFIPRNVISKLVTSMEVIAAKSDSLREVARVAGVQDISDLAGGPLSICDRLAAGFSARAERFAVVESTAFAFGGPLFHIPQQLIAALRSIMRVGHCYGYRFATPAEHATVIDILEISMLQEPAERQRVVQQLHAAIDNRADSFEGEQDLVARTSRNMVAEEALDFIPVVGTAVSFLFDCTFMHSVDETARRIFQERWLRDNGRVQAIEPVADVVRKSSFEEFGLALGQLMYTSGAIVGFTATVPAAFVRTLIGRRPNPIGRGARAGAERAVNDAQEFLAGARKSFDGAGFEGLPTPAPRPA